MTPTRTRAEIQAQIEKLQEELEGAWPSEGAAAYLKATVNQIDSDTDGIADVKVDGDEDIFQVYMDALIPAADLIPREEHEAALQDAQESCFDPTEQVLRDYHRDLQDQPGMGKQVSGIILGGYKYRVTVERVDAEPEPADMITREEHERAVAEARTDTKDVVVSLNARDAVKYLVNEYDLDTGHMDTVGPRTYPFDHNGHIYEVVVRRKAAAAPRASAVAPVGVVEFLSDIFEQAIDAYTKECGEPLCCTCQKYRDEARAALARITELPEPSEWALECVELDYPLRNRTRDEHLDLAAALLAKEGDHE